MEEICEKVKKLNLQRKSRNLIKVSHLVSACVYNDYQCGLEMVKMLKFFVCFVVGQKVGVVGVGSKMKMQQSVSWNLVAKVAVYVN